jgi:hypothetical protein
MHGHERRRVRMRRQGLVQKLKLFGRQSTVRLVRNGGIEHHHVPSPHRERLVRLKWRRVQRSVHDGGLIVISRHPVARGIQRIRQLPHRLVRGRRSVLRQIPRQQREVPRPCAGLVHNFLIGEAGRHPKNCIARVGEEVHVRELKKIDRHGGGSAVIRRTALPTRTVTWSYVPMPPRDARPFHPRVAPLLSTRIVPARPLSEGPHV